MEMILLGRQIMSIEEGRELTRLALEVHQNQLKFSLKTLKSKNSLSFFSMLMRDDRKIECSTNEPLLLQFLPMLVDSFLILFYCWGLFST